LIKLSQRERIQHHDCRTDTSFISTVIRNVVVCYNSRGKRGVRRSA